MNSLDRIATVERYQKRLLSHGVGIKAMASGVTARQEIRFEVLQGIGIGSGNSVLDLGCGLGDFQGWLNSESIEVGYTGYDLVPEFVEQGSTLYPQSSFSVRDIHEVGVGGRFDYIVASQVFNHKMDHEDNLEFAKKTIETCFSACDCGLAFDFLTAHVDYREDHLYYYDPAELFSWAKTLTKRVRLVHDHPLYEFALFLYPDFDGWAA